MSGTAHPKAILVLSILLGLFGAALQAQPAFQVVDLNTKRSDGINPGRSLPQDNFAALGGAVFFAASDGIRGSELWRTDGTQAGTRLVADLCPGSCSSTPQDFTVVGGLVFFMADDGLHERQLWKSDGTPAGTVLVKNLIPEGGLGWISGLTELNGLLFFWKGGYPSKDELWRSDGTAAGTFPLAAFDNSGTLPVPLARLGRKLFFFAQDHDHGREIWTTDGTAAGTALLKDVLPGPDGSAFSNPPAAVVGGKMLFGAAEGLWSSDGTEAGTILIKAVPVRGLIALGAEAFFFSNGGELWRSDGTAGGTRLIKTLSFSFGRLAVAGGRLFFFADCDLWTSDGSEAGTFLVKGTGLCEFSTVIENGGKLLFFSNDGVHGNEPWTSDGTQAGTSLLADLYPGPSSSSASFSGGPGLFVAGRWYFRAREGEEVGTQLWTTDGTAAGTRMLWINQQQSGFRVNRQGKLAGPRVFSDLNGILLFQGDDGGAAGAELWKSNGTAAGTSLVKDLQPGPGSCFPGELTRAGSSVFFRCDAEYSPDVWKTDGTSAGTRRIFSPALSPDGGSGTPAKDLTPHGHDLLFLGMYDYYFLTLFKTDGTEEGTEQIGLGDVLSLVSLGNHVLFQSDPDELWESHGTSTAPVLLGKILPADRSLDSSSVRKGVLYFAGTTPATGEELWQSDGTPAGTRLVAEIVPGPDSKRLGPFAVAGPTLFFVAGGNELWTNDARGTRLVRKLPGDSGAGVRSLTALGGRVYFSYDDGVNGRELWVSDGTRARTRMLKDVLPGSGSSHPRELHVEGNVLLFSAADGVHGFEPWRSDGTAAGTRMLQDIAPGSLSSNPTEFTASGSYVYFAANDGTTGFELWALPRRALRGRP